MCVISGGGRVANKLIVSITEFEAVCNNELQTEKI